ncbi:MAG: hypothetical protein ACYTGN_15010 [Planctomycetota bacterium]
MKTVTVAFVLGLATNCGAQPVRIGKSTTIVFATVAQGRAVLTNRDDFVERMSPADRAARMKKSGDISEKEYLEFVGRNVSAWTKAEQRRITAAIDGVKQELEALSLPLPTTVLVIKTTGQEEFGAAYTRANAVVFPGSYIERPVPVIRETVCHELFHIASRSSPDLRERLYAAIGFVKCDEVAFPPALKAWKITNPDAPRNDHCIRIQVEGKDRWAVPILYLDEKYDVVRGGQFFKHVRFPLLLVERDNQTSSVKPLYQGEKAVLVEMKDKRVTGFFEQVGENTDYIIHPEEILADNFAYLVLRRRNLPSPEITEELERILEGNRKAGAD